MILTATVPVDCSVYDKRTRTHVKVSGAVTLRIDANDLATQMCGCLHNKRKRSVRAQGAIIARPASLLWETSQREI